MLVFEPKLSEFHEFLAYVTRWCLFDPPKRTAAGGMATANAVDAEVKSSTGSISTAPSLRVP